MRRLFWLGDVLQLPVTIAAYVGAAFWLGHQMTLWHITFPWQLAVIAGALILGFAASAIQVLALRALRTGRPMPTTGSPETPGRHDSRAELESVRAAINNANARAQAAATQEAQAVAAQNFNRTHRLELFRLGRALANIREFDGPLLGDLTERCESLGLTYSAAKIERILETNLVDQAGAEETGKWDFSETHKMFEFEMKDMEDVIRTELERS